MQFTEIEVKYVIKNEQAYQELKNNISSCLPEDRGRISSRDSYFVLTSLAGHIARYRYDERLQQLSLKSLRRQGNSRQEINLELDIRHGDQKEAVKAFLQAFGPSSSIDLYKEVEVFHFPAVEIVLYQARNGFGEAVLCLEIEATHFASEQEAEALIKSYEERIQASLWAEKTEKSIFELLCRKHLAIFP